MVLLRELSLATFLALASSASAFYGKSSGVITLDSKNFEKEILNTEHASVHSLRHGAGTVKTLNRYMRRPLNHSRASQRSLSRERGRGNQSSKTTRVPGKPALSLAMSPGSFRTMLLASRTPNLTTSSLRITKLRRRSYLPTKATVPLTEGTSSADPSKKETSGTTQESKTPTVKETPTPKPKLTIPSLEDQNSLAAACLQPKSKTCILAIISSSAPTNVLTEVYNKLLSRSPAGAFNVYILPAGSAHTQELAEKLLMVGDGAKLIALNARRGWLRKFGGDLDSEEDVLAWLDAMRLGDGAKEKLPAGVVVEEEEEGHGEL
ncbi:unnamed protein product [Tuber melanosporum]|uniref:(Perigord truffle) hypothetical protein n=1 Tax=Tuber melanosporum (strain Mel28) TaxID=656061 RepID=D5G9T7_TUBMM|nr:uncharacterized protein GSTUM_00005065001 [Tuber melanosporum]CAZ81280.1 unnamed protein product [Tuber melanosporum]